jgi:molybdenum cofactor cytidylyltransferase
MADEIVGILLAAGASRRFGGDKLMHRLPDGVPMAIAAATKLRATCRRVMAVVRPGHEALAGLLAEAGCEIVPCPRAEQGMGESLAAGVRAAPDAAGWLLALADMPFIAASSHQAVLSCLQAGASLAAPRYAGRRGHPVGFAREWFPQLAALTGDQGAKSILESHRQKLILCPVDDPGVIRDIDRPENLLGAD